MCGATGRKGKEAWGRWMRMACSESDGMGEEQRRWEGADWEGSKVKRGGGV